MGSLLGHPRSHVASQLAFIARETRGWIEGGGEIAKLETQLMQKVDELPLLGKEGRGMGIAKQYHNRINFPLDICEKANRKFALFRKSSILHLSLERTFKERHYRTTTLPLKGASFPPPPPSPEGETPLLIIPYIPK